MFRKLHKSDETVSLSIDGNEVIVTAGISVAAAMLLDGPAPYRLTAIKQTPRAPYCMMGGCFDCLIEIDGQPNQQGCMVMVVDGMVIRRGQGKRKIGL
jgi:predicted molibdopterin-dependent oxidoreductase YjgC